MLAAETNVTRLCHEKAVPAVNGEFPGPTIYARKGDVVVVNVYNQGHKNITIHWHGVDQPRNPWFDGPEYITQCPIAPGSNFTYRIIFSGEEGTIWWHAHSDFDRATVHGAIVVHPELGSSFPYPKPHKEIPIILGEWWNMDVEKLLEETKRTGGDFKISDANTINGQPGDLFPCSKDGTFRVSVEHGETYLLRVINAGLSNDMFFAVAGHTLTVVGTDGHYLKPFTTGHVMISSGQTMDLLLHAINGSASRYYMAARTFQTNTELTVNNTTATAILEYTDAPPLTAGSPELPVLPAVDDLAAATAYTAALRSLATVDVPTHVDEHMVVTISVNVLPCKPSNGDTSSCEGPINGTWFAASLNNVSFVASPTGVDILDAYYHSIHGVYTSDFPSRPPVAFNFTEPEPGTELWFTERGMILRVQQLTRKEGQAVLVLRGKSSPPTTAADPLRASREREKIIEGRGMLAWERKGAASSGGRLQDRSFADVVFFDGAGLCAAGSFIGSNEAPSSCDKVYLFGLLTCFMVGSYTALA
ncbi:hypothetical protein HU200_004296 [Digitaria exilis]|uniref:laccase n=1 Tax=Digitaria exilis TaxID=1010633 RepID=A0A835FW45_9POAL|nr:hypothetical protein HU200_004296 [Digitaria exilis]